MSLQNRISGYDDSIAEYDANIASSKSDADKYAALAAKPQENTLQNALISAAIQIIPGLIGYAASGKQGAALGLQGGLAGGQIYQDILGKRHTEQKNQNTLLAKQAQSDLSLAQQAKSKLEGRKLGLEDWAAKNAITSSQKNARASQNQSGLTAAIDRIAPYLRGGAQQTPEPVEDATPTSTPSLSTEDSNSKKIFEILQSTEEGRQLMLEDPNFVKKIADIEGKALSNQSAEKSIEKLGAETTIKQAEATELDRLKKAISSKTEIPMAGLGLKPTDTTPTDVDSVNTVSDIISTGNQLFKRLIEYSQLIKNQNALGRMSSGEARSIRSNIVEDIATFRSLRREGTRAPTSDDRRAAERDIPDITSLGENIKEQATVSPLEFVAPMLDRIAGVANQERNNLISTLKNRYNFEVSDASEAGQSQAQVFNRQEQISRPTITDAQGNVKVLSEDGKSWVDVDGR